ncbi:MAG TPA: ATP-binding cassette domain-containing protein, partial [Rectinemataceae bacterium]|nr:ATP-binding cassette domain-containing protein [Rectinemataceae bacterium]
MSLLAVRGLTKFFPSTGVLANDDISLSIDEGEIVAVVGENGAGKSTLARIVGGLVAPDSGEVEIGGRRLRGGSVREAERAGVGLVPQHSFLAEGLDVAEALCLGREPRRFGILLDRRKMRESALALAESAGIELDPGRRVGDLSPAERRHAEILRALAWAGDLLILDEPTSLLDDEEGARLFELLKGLSARGKAIVFISHRAAELAAIATRIVVLRSGRLVADRPAGAFAAGELPALMSRSRAVRSGPPAFANSGEAPTPGRVVAAARGIVLVASHGKARLDFEVRAGECLAVVALAGNGLEELETVASGLGLPVSGGFELEGRDVRSWSRRELRRDLAGYVPSDREGRGLALDATVAANLGVLEGRAADSAAEAILGPGGDVGRRAEALSGGNRQRLVLSRELATRRPFLLLADPSQGLDRAGVEDLADILETRKAEGAAILLLSSSIEEALRLGDRL